MSEHAICNLDDLESIKKVLEIAKLYVIRYPKDKQSASVIMCIDEARTKLINFQQGMKKTIKTDDIVKAIING